MFHIVSNFVVFLCPLTATNLIILFSMQVGGCNLGGRSKADGVSCCRVGGGRGCAFESISGDYKSNTLTYPGHGRRDVIYHQFPEFITMQLQREDNVLQMKLCDTTRKSVNLEHSRLSL
jgi:hypothetical protein